MCVDNGSFRSESQITPEYELIFLMKINNGLVLLLIELDVSSSFLILAKETTEPSLSFDIHGRFFQRDEYIILCPEEGRIELSNLLMEYRVLEPPRLYIKELLF
jgi:hypothetical protein